MALYFPDLCDVEIDVTDPPEGLVEDLQAALRRGHRGLVKDAPLGTVLGAQCYLTGVEVVEDDHD